MRERPGPERQHRRRARAAIVVGMAAAWVAAALAPSAGTRAADKRVDVGGFRLHVRCVGEGSPTVVLDAGAGDTLETWDWVVPGVKKITRVCAYDRAGLGKSEPGPKPRTSGRIVDELAELLRRAPVPGPYLLVGHSFGGLNMRLFAAKHPDLVAGLVLVDATPDDYPEREAALSSPAEREKMTTAMGGAPAAFRDELASIAESASEVRAAAAASGPPKAPVVIISAAHRQDSQAFRAAWGEMQGALARSFPTGRQIVAATSDHYVQFDQPELVVNSIREMVEAARAKAP